MLKVIDFLLIDMDNYLRKTRRNKLMSYKIHIYFGDGKGKTTATAGLAVRYAGKGGKVIFAQFLKDGTSGEVSVLKKIKGIEYRRVEKAFGFTWTMSENEKKIAADEYKNLFDSVLRTCAGGELIVLDEILDLIRVGFIDESYVINKILSLNGKREILLTGHSLGEKTAEIADYITEMKKIKHPFDRGLSARPGIEY